jgi:hypothetical protein
MGLRVYLKPLPPEHELRNCPLEGAFYHATDGKFSREVFPSYGIAKKTYNDLGPAWTGSEEFYFEIRDEE